MENKKLQFHPSEIANLKGDAAKAEFLTQFKKIQKLKIRLDQYTDVDAESKQQIEQLLSADHLRGFRSAYLEIVQELKKGQETGDANTKETEQDTDGDSSEKTKQLDFELILFSSVLIDYDYIMGLIAKITQQKITSADLINFIQSHAGLEEEKEYIIEYVNNLKPGVVLDKQTVCADYEKFKEEKLQQILADIAQKHGLETNTLRNFVDNILDRKIFDSEHLIDLMAPMELGWKDRMEKETDLMKDLGPYLRKLARGQDISGLSAYE